MESSVKKKSFSGKDDLKKLWKRLKNRDFSGHTGLALKNSWYQLLTNITTKLGALIFTVLLARILMPSLFGAYNLALSVILIFVAFSDLGIGDTVIRFVSRKLEENNLEKAKSYLKYLTKLKFILIILLSLIMILTAKIISNAYSNYPIYLALIAGALYIFFVGFVSYFIQILQAYNHFKAIFYRETIFQIIRIIVIPLLIIYLLKNSFTNEWIIFWIIGILAATYIFSGLFLLFYRKTNLYSILKQKKNSLHLSEKKEVNHFIYFLSANIFSGVFFGYIDTIILGLFVESQYLGYYRAAFSIIAAIGPLITLSAALYPIFNRLNRENLELLFKRSVKLTLILSIIISIFLFLFSNIIIYIIFGTQYSLSSTIFRFFSIVLASIPLTSLYSVYFESIGKPNIVTKSLVWSTILNIVLNLFFVAWLIRYSELWAVYGAMIATIISRWFYVIYLIVAKHKNDKEPIDRKESIQQAYNPVS